MTMRTGATIVVATIGLGVMSGCSLDGRARETDRMVDTLALAVSYPPQASIDGYHRAILDTRIARQAPDPETNGQANDDPTTYLIVLDTETHERPDDVSDRAGRIRVLVHLPGSQAGFVRSEPYDACYDLFVSTTGGAVDRERIDCPSDPVPAGPPPPPPPVAVVPPGAAQDVDRVLQRLPRSPTAWTVVRAVEHGLASPVATPTAGATSPRPSTPAWRAPISRSPSGLLSHGPA